MSKHTPGPWKWIKESSWYALNAANGARVADDGSAGDEYNREIDPEDEGESGANARLIAAAPELLEALQSIKEDIESDHGTGYDWQKAWAAIAKATGATE